MKSLYNFIVCSVQRISLVTSNREIVRRVEQRRKEGVNNGVHVVNDVLGFELNERLYRQRKLWCTGRLERRRQKRCKGIERTSSWLLFAAGRERIEEECRRRNNTTESDQRSK